MAATVRDPGSGRAQPASQGLDQWPVFGESGAVRFEVEPTTSPATNAAGLAIPRGATRVAANRQYFETGDGLPMPLVGACVCWPGARGTFDYDDWFAGMSRVGENYTRLWMAPWAFGIEAEPGTLTQYRLDRAWQLDYVLQLAEQKGIGIMLCLDYHGMFETEIDVWGGNNYWPKHPYNAVQGGPCANPNAFFTSTAARAIYQKRLRYLVARYGYSSSLLAWEFFNELDNVYRYLVPADVAPMARGHGGLAASPRSFEPSGDHQPHRRQRPGGHLVAARARFHPIPCLRHAQTGHGLGRSQPSVSEPLWQTGGDRRIRCGLAGVVAGGGPVLARVSAGRVGRVAGRVGRHRDVVVVGGFARPRMPIPITEW